MRPAPSVLASRCAGGVARRAAARGAILLAAGAALLLAGCRSEASPAAAAPPLPPRAALVRQAIEALHVAQREGDVDQHLRADAVATQLLQRFGPDATALTIRATARAGLHHFADAVASADRAVDLDPADPAPYPVLADALIELGDYERALATVQHLLALRPSHAAYARAAYLRSLYGDQAGGLRLMRLAVAATPSNAPAERAWYLVHLGGDALAAGEDAAAVQAFADALALRPGDPRALQGLAALAAAGGDDRRAIDLYERAAATGLNGDAHAALADLYAADGRSADAARHLAAAERAAEAARRGPGAEPRPLALLWADHDLHREAALRLAEQDAARRDDVYAADALAWTLYRAGRIAEARKAARRALRLGTRDPLLLFHAGLIAAAAGARDDAVDLLTAAAARPAVLGPRRLREAGDALASLDRAAAAGSSCRPGDVAACN